MIFNKYRFILLMITLLCMGLFTHHAEAALMKPDTFKIQGDVDKIDNNAGYLQVDKVNYYFNKNTAKMLKEENIKKFDRVEITFTKDGSKKNIIVEIKSVGLKPISGKTR